MSAVILYFPTRRVRAAAVAQAVRLAALRLGFHPHNADFVAIIARRDFLQGRCSAARAISDMVEALNEAARHMRTKGGAA
ncbi:hypothetical protein DI041_03875 [Stenotrophomonas maltophilia]|uniref:hypothetical protein n=1 Tax=Stenotrophomonas maltophilia TaxID=40324 RepID=UPI0010AADA5A|nr:hypothetical protein [Stenotrophomonas maltophilia]TIE21024.1 hypothetical protein DI034_02255 [Stenotrophomonas maltophilia]TIE64465.1 hypothetical protein DI041_03875 [Stenotrophomonas maltophilia]